MRMNLAPLPVTSAGPSKKKTYNRHQVRPRMIPKTRRDETRQDKTRFRAASETLAGSKETPSSSGSFCCVCDWLTGHGVCATNACVCVPPYGCTELSP
eukprot:COSAG06_NODE_13_length_35352_cov_49.626255_16_plen_98_part_00